MGLCLFALYSLTISLTSGIPWPIVSAICCNAPFPIWIFSKSIFISSASLSNTANLSLKLSLPNFKIFKFCSNLIILGVSSLGKAIDNVDVSVPIII